jgi:hypothetical protein
MDPDSGRPKTCGTGSATLICTDPDPAKIAGKTRISIKVCGTNPKIWIRILDPQHWKI